MKGLFGHIAFAIQFSLVWAVLLSPAGAFAGNWPAWRGDGTGIVKEGNAPVHWSETENVVWKTFIPGRGMSSPIVDRDRVFLTTAVEGVQRNAAKVKVWWSVAAIAAILTAGWLMRCFQLRLRYAKADTGLQHQRPGRSMVAPVLCAVLFGCVLIGSEMIMDIEGPLARTWIAGSAARTWLLSGAAGVCGLIAASLCISGTWGWRLPAALVLGGMVSYFVFGAPDTIQYFRHPSRYVAWTLMGLGLIVGAFSRGRFGWWLIAGGSAIAIAVLSYVLYLHAVNPNAAMYVRFWLIAGLLSGILTAFIGRRLVAGSAWRSGRSTVPLLGAVACLLFVAMVGLQFYGANFLLPEKGLFRTLLCYDAGDGGLLWKAGYLTTELENLHIENSYATPTPTTDGSHVYAYYGAGGAMCVDYRGNLKWTNQSLPLDTRFGSASSPVIADGVLFLACDNDAQSYVTALDVDTGEFRWYRERDSFDSYGTPMVCTINGKKQLVLAGGKLMVGYELATGEVLWSTFFPISEVVPSVVVKENVVYYAGGWGGARIGAIELDAEGNPGAPRELWETTRFAPVHPSPLIVDDLLFTVTDLGVAACRDRLTGKKKWVKRLRGSYRASPIMVDGRIYFLNTEGEMTIIECGPKFVQIANSSVGDACYASPAVADGKLYIRSEKYLWCIGGESAAEPNASPSKSLSRQ